MKIMSSILVASSMRASWIKFSLQYFVGNEMDGFKKVDTRGRETS